MKIDGVEVEEGDFVHRELTDDSENGIYKVTSEKTFFSELSELLNRYSKENDSNTPDCVLAQYLGDCLRAFNLAVNTREITRS